ncbi:hypothetical protein P2P98_16575, partial [Microbacterium sp. Kw_RZR3]|uniref:hypothetical protein n=1 Tax=Microbacterium sp. Kw_RZR3 TaxID=3032903 RepID=UPI0023DAC7BF
FRAKPLPKRRDDSAHHHARAERVLLDKLEVNLIPNVIELARRNCEGCLVISTISPHGMPRRMGVTAKGARRCSRPK